ncbi:MurR/RpiR family transcriptional regulator [Leucobacter sp. UCMA 4100]|uniref:MurR/RpiR family transcriptional regulator n=1 Tax=Leucobacter sp. UCMA 4100 TaxID=2810534 RepID=UPI0022EACDA3|nr:MurR/RpiR family transcriptional regulator [Leucobacter sp. UCMA 4100]MDA3147237.1 MurR/RpiR family transcriptional regulator [Leucobacter sp. UCMA 4100]
MTWQGASDSHPSVRIASLAPSMQPTERRVAQWIAQDRQAAVECSAQDIADQVGVGRTTVIRATRTLGYDGFPQLRVALAQELALETVADDAEPSDQTRLGKLRQSVAQFSGRLGDSVAALTAEGVDAFVDALDTADRVLVVANGLSGPLALDLVLRLNAAGRPAEYFSDGMAQMIAARQLGEGSTCIVLSGSGANRATLDVMEAVRAGGAHQIVITSFAKSAAHDLADTTLVVPPVKGGFHDELMHTSRAALMLVTELLVQAFVEHRGERGRQARLAALSVLAGSLQEPRGE